MEVAVPLQGVELHPPLGRGRGGILKVCGGLAQEVVGMEQGNRNARLVLPPAFSLPCRMWGGNSLQAPAAEVALGVTSCVHLLVLGTLQPYA